MSCCEIPIGASGVAHCYSNSTNLHKEGCLTKFGDYIRGHAVTVEAVGIGFAIVQVITHTISLYEDANMSKLMFVLTSCEE